MKNVLLPNSMPYSPSVANLRSLLAIRAIALLGQTGVLAYVVVISRSTQSLWGLTVGLLVLGLFTAVSLWRTTRAWPVTQGEFLWQLLVDVIGWTVLMYFSGGADNPFVSYYIVPLVVAAAVLPWRFTWLVAAVSLVAYSALFYWHQPFSLFAPHAGMDHGNGASIHTLGMWFNFLFSAGLITYFVVRMAAVLRQKEEREAELREAGLRNDQIMAVASLAAGTAHELATPLSTMTVLVDEILVDETLSSTTRVDCEQLREQLKMCRSTLAALSRTAESSAIGELQHVNAQSFIESVVERWGLRRPRVARQLATLGASPAPELAFDLTLPQALENLLNNAADTGSKRIAVSVNWDRNSIWIEIQDWGPGIPPQILQKLHNSDYASDSGGLGIGLLLTRATVERHGGQLALRSASGGGTVARVTLPVFRSPTGLEAAA